MSSDREAALKHAHRQNAAVLVLEHIHQLAADGIAAARGPVAGLDSPSAFAPAPTTLGQRINAARVAHGLSWRQLGERCGLGESTVRCLCDRSYPSWPIVVRVARALALDLNVLAGD